MTATIYKLLRTTITLALLTGAAAFAQFYPSVAGNPADNSKYSFATGGGTAQAQTATLSPAPRSYSTGLIVYWIPTNSNTGAGPTLNVNSLGAKNVTKCGTTALVASDLVTTTVAFAIYDGTQFQLLNPQSANCGAGGGGSPAWSAITAPAANLSLSMGTFTTTMTYGDLGASPANLFNITDASTTSTDLSYNLNLDTGSGSFHNPLSVSITGAKQFQVCRQPGPQGQVVIGGAVTCPNIDQSPFAKFVLMSQTASHDNMRIYQGSTVATGNMISMNNATAAGSGFFFFKANTGCTAGDSGCDTGTITASLRGDGLFTGSASLSALTLSAITGSTQCLQVNTSGVVSGTGSACGAGGGGSGTVNSGSSGQVAWYATTGTAVSGNSNLTIDVGGDIVSNGTGTFTQVITTGPWFMSSPWPASGLSAGSASQTIAGTNNDGFINISVNADGPFPIARLVAQGTHALATGTINSGTCATADAFTVTGAATTDRVSWNFNADVTSVTGYTAATTGALRVDVWASASNTVSVRQCNPTGSSITPGAATIIYQIVRK